ncbi:hypothetical protein [Thermoactinomyces sp. CICC 23799]|jgi:Phage phiEco32-like COOH.NH2 ligase-type 2|uniref:putative amidoligase domain-containing protein n=1 Tax=Thermoactinomyces sp. CICC 23799 TaxID=2767429 RepID=UPI0018DCE6E9|nr:hypothetical protein [Thermoactinomyces sp. CICC 23799]MBH8602202.1 hypothetical protein [Thermoactinomyces sp. CICC 23799]
MGAVTLPYMDVNNQQSIRNLLIEQQGRLASTIHLEKSGSVAVSEPVLILNDERYVQRTKNPSTCHRILRMHGIPVHSHHQPVLREYMVAVFQTNVLAVYCSNQQGAWLAEPKRKRKNSFRRVSLQDPSREVRKIKEWAVRALYALGLDYGLVRLAVGPNRKYFVRQVVCDPKLNKELKQSFVKAVQEYVKECVNLPAISWNQVVLGADPEFIMEGRSGGLLIASRYFPVKGRVGCDAIWMNQNRSLKPLVEIRPEPTSDPRALAINIFKGLLYAAKKTGRAPAKWLAGALPRHAFPLGGHIHFSGVQPNFKLLRALDNYLALLLAIVEDPQGIGRRPKYGFLGDFRYQDHGGFEYRTLPSWLISPTLTKGVFVVAKLIAIHYRYLNYYPLDEEEVQEAYYQGDKEVLAEWLPVLWSELKKCPYYVRNKEYLDKFYRYLTSGSTWNESQDIRKVWKLPPYHKKK